MNTRNLKFIEITVSPLNSKNSRREIKISFFFSLFTLLKGLRNDLGKSAELPKCAKFKIPTVMSKTKRQIRVSAEKSKTISSDFMFSAEGGRNFWTAWQVFEGFFQENDEKSVKFVDFVCFFRSCQANSVSARRFENLPGF